MKKRLTPKELHDLAHAALNDVAFGDESDPYVQRIERIARKALDISERPKRVMVPNVPAHIKRTILGRK